MLLTTFNIFIAKENKNFINNLLYRIRLEQVIQYGVKSANNKPVDLTSNNFRIEESFVWMKKISKPLAPLSNIESNFQNVESDLNQVQAKDLFYSVTSEDNITNDVSYLLHLIAGSLMLYNKLFLYI